MTALRHAMLGLSAVLCLSALASAGEVRNAKVTTDGSVDCSSPESMATATLKGKTDEEKILNFWHWYRRTMWHYHEWPERRDLTVCMLSEGCTLCGSHAALQMMILKAGGYKTRPCFVMGGGHTFIEVFYGERWHALDAMTGFYVYSRNEPRYILSLEEMKADPTLVSKAVEEKRVPDVFFACAREPEIKKTKTLPWSHFHGFNDMVTYYADGAVKGSIGKEGDAYGGSYVPGKMNINLRPGESVTRTWDFEAGKYPEGFAYKGNAEVGPYHRCGLNDENDKVNFPYWEPYRKDNLLEVKRCYRYFANGRFDRRLSAERLLESAAVKKNVKLDGGALAADGAPSGTIELLTAFPYIICDGEVKVAYSRAADGDEVSLYILEKSQARKLWSAAKTGEQTETVALGRFSAKELDLHKYTLRLVVGGGARVKSMDVSTIFMHNMFAMPYFVPGKNTVNVSVENADELAKHPLTVTYKYFDGEGWKDEHVVAKKLDKSPLEFTVEVKGQKHPKMRSLTLEVE